ncbi:MAG: nitroreductase family protein [Caldilineaceae bacterium]|nr:nitroreductase family protein [Caldilineaceae bacterium]
MDLATVDHLLTTTRSVRKRLDFARPVERSVIEACLQLAIQAPSGSNRQGWHFLVITDPAKRAIIARYYRQAFKHYLGSEQPAELDPLRANEESTKGTRILKSASYLSRHLHEAPVHIIPCIEGRVETTGLMAQASLYGSILPATWSLMLALRSRGLGSVWTTLHLAYEQEIGTLLGIPPTITQAALLPVAYYLGDDFKPAQRKPLAEVLHWETW